MEFGSEEYWEERRARIVRARRRAALRDMVVVTAYALLALALIAAVVMAVREVALRSRNDRAAYLSGRWGLDEADALVMAAAYAAATGEGEEEVR